MTCYEFWSVIIAALSCFATASMAIITWRTLYHNSKQLKYIVAQNTPKITGQLKRSGKECCIVLYNTSQVPVSGVTIDISFNSDKPIPDVEETMRQIKQYPFSFSPNGEISIKTSLLCPPGVQVPHSGCFHIVAYWNEIMIGEEYLSTNQLNIIL